MAILGMGCRFPGARGLDAFARRLLEGHDAITEVPEDRWDAEAIYDPDLFEPLRASTKWGGFVEDVDRFDAGFFGIGETEAIAMDPQQRVLLETAWEALEDAHLPPSVCLGARGGVWVAVSHDEYAERALRSAEGQNAYAATGTELSMGANRLSRWLRWSGPSVAVNTGCSSALVALELATHALMRGEVDVAIVGAVSLQLEPGATIALSQAWMMAADGRCKAFDASADGYVRSEGCGVLVLRRAGEGGRPRAIVRGVAVGYGSGASATTPDPEAQAEVMRRALDESGVAPSEVSFVEAHGVGTRRGDAAEMASLHPVYGEGDAPCLLGSVKTNVGHLEWASGMPAIARTLIAFERGLAPPHLHLREPSPDARIEGSRFVVPAEPTAWTGRYAAVSSFGLGGTLAHAVLERADVADDAPAREGRLAAEEPGLGVEVIAELDGSRPSEDATKPSDLRVVHAAAADPEASSEREGSRPAEDSAKPSPVHVVRVTAADPEAFDTLAERYAEALHDGLPLADLAYTSVAARDTLAFVGHVVASTAREAATALEALRPSRPRNTKLALLFTGQGAQRAGMMRALLALDASHASVLDRLPGPVREALLHDDAPIDATELAQPALFVFEVLLLRTLARYGVRADAALGHSVGEYAAAVAVGILTFDDGLALVCERGRAMGALPRRGGMMAVVADEATLAPRLAPFGDALDLAAVNAPDRLVVSGDDDALDALEATLDAHDVTTQRLRVSHAFHSAHMAPMLDAFEAVASAVRFEKAAVPLARNVDGALVDTLDARTLRDGLRGAVRFADGVQTLAEHGCGIFVEVGPTPTLAKLVTRTRRDVVARAAFDPRDPERALAQTLAVLADHGVPVDLATYEAERGGGLRRLPSYPFRRTRFWIERSETTASTQAKPTVSLEGLSTEARRRRLQGLVRSVLEARAGRSLDAKTPFFELGLRSIDLVQARAELAAALGPTHAPSVSALFAYPTIDALSRHLAGHRSDVTVATSSRADEPVAIVGVALRLPGGVVDLDRYFDVLDRAEPLASDAPPERGLRRRAAWLDAIDRFDATHFGLAPDEAAAMDPQHRWLLEASWHALEDAGRPPDALSGTATGVFFGLLSNDYGRRVEAGREPSAHGLVGNLPSAAAGRLSHLLGLRGPALVIDTACSSSLVALHLAAESIRRGESTLALAGGASLLLDDRGFAALERARALAPDGRSKTFAAAADGYGRGEGVVVLALCPLADAMARGDRIHAVVLGSGVNHDGRAAGLTAPSGAAQASLVRSVLARAEVLPEEVDYVECHGTGTALGDPIEVEALADALGGVPRAIPLRLGSAKAVVGHGEAVAGANGIAKVLACLRREAIPPQPLEGGVHPSLALPRLGAVVPERRQAWPKGRRRVAAVSAFGMSGTNAHVLLGDPPDRTVESAVSTVSTVSTVTPPWIALGARSEEALARLAALHRDALRECRDLDLYARATRTRRAHGPHRLAVVASSAAEASEALDAWLAGRDHHACLTGDTFSELADDPADTPFASLWGWLNGEALDEPVGPHVALPLTPFAPERHWLDAPLDCEAPSEAGARPSASPPLSSLGFSPERVPPVPRETPRTLAAIPPSAWSSPDSLVLPAADHVWFHLPTDTLEVEVAKLAALARHAASTSPSLPFVCVLFDDPTDVRAVGLASAMRVIRHEHPELDASTLVVDRTVALDDALERWASHVLPLEVIVRANVFEVSRADRVVRHASPRPPTSDEVVALVATEPGFLDEVRPVAQARPPRAAGEVRLRVDAVALAFPDALRATGLLDDANLVGRIGVEARGVVVESDELAPGTPVVALVPDGAASEVVVPRALVLPCRDEAEAERLFGHVLSELVAFEVERLVPWVDDSHRVLVQSATGAIGRACLHRFRNRGATVFATAGDDTRRARAEALGAQRAFPSRHDGWHDAVLDATEGEGVDVVVASTSGEGPALALDVLREGGVVIDLDRRSGHEAPTLRPNRGYVRLDVLALARCRPERVRAVLEALRDRTLPPTPKSERPFASAAHTLREMAHATHDGKLALRFDPVDASPDRWRAREGTYLVTGGLGGLGIEVARWLIGRGARHVALLSRRSPSPEALEALAPLREHVTTHAVDVTRRDTLEALVATFPSLAGVIHAAGVLDDGLIEAQSLARIRPVLAPKLAAEVLDDVAPDVPLFVLFGSVAGSLGNVGQLAYAAGNGALLAVAERRRRRGRHALCVDWGPWAEVGMAAERARVMTSHGARPLSVQDALGRLERALLADATHTVELDADLPALVRSMPSLRPRLAETLVPIERAESPLARELATLRVNDRRARATEAMVTLAAGLVVGGRVDPDAPLSLDSLAAVELRERARARFGVALPAAAFLRSTPRALGDAWLAAWGLGEAAPVEGRVLVPLRPATRARARLLCLPFAGGDPRVFAEWPDRLPGDVDVLAVEWPGRGARHAESPHRRMDVLLAELLDALRPELDLPLVIFGHCMGALVGYELTRALEAVGRAPVHLVASACPGPREYAVPALRPATRRYDRGVVGDPAWVPVHAHDDEGLAEVLRFLGFAPTRHLLADAELRRALLPTLRADFEVCGTYEHSHAGRLVTPLTLLGGDQDPFATPEEVTRWREVGLVARAHTLPGDHYFLFPERDAVLAALNEVLASRPTSMRDVHV
ncbi:MAG: SDR family NAD(P)-dependent oxidoreductase [Polyangiales bacterium]